MQEDEAVDLCTKFVHLKDNERIVWSSIVEPLSGQPAYTRDMSLLDADADGVADIEDTCPESLAGFAVNARGCGFDQ
jgi:hypothetical protein